MSSPQSFYQFLEDGVTFRSSEALHHRTIYFPLAGQDARSIKSAITPFLSGDIKIDKAHYLTRPASTEDLRNCVRNFFIRVEGKGVFSVTQPSKGDSSCIEAGLLWHKLIVNKPSAGLKLEVLNFVPTHEATLELMRVSVQNISSEKIDIIPTAVVPIFARALENKHDHEHVTSLLNRIKQLPEGVLVEPTMLFDEKGHRTSDSVYYVFGITRDQENPIGSFPTATSFFGEEGNAFAPEAIMKNRQPVLLDKKILAGQEAVGALRFKEEGLNPGESKKFFIVIGIGKNEAHARRIWEAFNSEEKFTSALKANKKFWLDKSSAVSITTGNRSFDSWMRWVSVQPVLRRIFGCSFLPDHDYGKGGKGWRDIWQDKLSLILIEPETVREDLVNNFAGVRIDGSNATIIGSNPGEFIADRNRITRVWMDHGVWPLTTLLLYINQTGDYDVLWKEVPYFKDEQLSRTTRKDASWSLKQGPWLKDKKGKVYRGTIFEHLLVQHLVQFFNVGEHNNIRLESADWNDGLDMAFARGESVGFSAFYGGNLLALADILEILSERKNLKEVFLLKELNVLLDSLSRGKVNYDNAGSKKRLLFEKYLKAVEPRVSGEKKKVKVQAMIDDLRRKGNWIFDHIRNHEKIVLKDGAEKDVWFNGCYDNKGKRVEGKKGERVWMTLSGQVFPIMSGMAKEEEIKEVVKSVNKYLKDRTLGGIRLNTDFNQSPYLDLGRAFGFAYGTKENGAFFNHMSVMYAYALYKRGFVKEGHDVLTSIYQMSSDGNKANIYPGIPEYFDSEGRGRYHYLTGSASWLLLTMLTQVFGVRGEGGDLILSPKLLQQQFSKEKTASIACRFAGKDLVVEYLNSRVLDHGTYKIKSIKTGHQSLVFEQQAPDSVKIKLSLIKKLAGPIKLQVLLD